MTTEYDVIAEWCREHKTTCPSTPVVTMGDPGAGALTRVVLSCDHCHRSGSLMLDLAAYARGTEPLAVDLQGYAAWWADCLKIDLVDDYGVEVDADVGGEWSLLDDDPDLLLSNRRAFHLQAFGPYPGVDGWEPADGPDDRQGDYGGERADSPAGRRRRPRRLRPSPGPAS
jgi:hypothetical protein